MKKIKSFLKKYQKIIKWTLTNTFIVLFGVSVIVNITYLPKYFQLAQQRDNTLKIQIIAYDETDETNKNKLFDIHYQTLMVTLGDLMASYPQVYHLKTKGALAREIYSITVSNQKHQEKELKGDTAPGQTYRWRIEYKDQKTTGIDSVYLHDNDVYKLYYRKE